MKTANSPIIDKHNGKYRCCNVDHKRVHDFHRQCHRCICLLVVLAVSGFHTVVWAQLEEIIVTARKIEENLQETPISMSVFTAAQIDSFGFNDLTDIGRFSPNVVFDQGTGNTGSSNNTQYFIRGVGQVDFLFTSDPGVGIYIDDVYLPRVTGSMLDLIDLERIEILRGPQGTLFGKNTIGGAIIVISKGPDGELNGTATVTAGTRDRIDAKGAINFPLIENQLSGRLSVSTRNQDGYVKRVLMGGEETGNVNSDAVRGQLRWTPENDWDIVLAGDYTRGREEAIANELLTVDTAAPVLQLWNLLVAPSYGPGIAYDERYLSPDWKSQATGPNYSDIDDWGVSLNITKQFANNLQFKSVTAYRDTEAKFGIDVDYSPLTYMQTSNDNDHDQVSQEVQLSGDGFGSRLNWVSGIFYMHESATDVFDLDLAAGLYDALEALPAGIIPGLGGVGNPVHVSLDLDATIFDAIKIDSYAAYTQGTFDTTDKLSLTVGVRYTDEKKDFTTMMIRNASGVTSVPKTELSASWDATTPHAAIQYQWTADVMSYVSASRGFKSGGFNGRALSVNEIDEFDPEYVWSYEVGLKSQWFGRRLMANLAVFHNDYSDIQLTSIRDVQGLVVAVTENAGEAEMEGFELEIAAQPTERLLIRGGLGYLDAKYTNLDPGATVTLDSELVKTPDWTGSLSVDYTWPLGDMGTLTFGGDMSYRSSHYNEPTNLAILEQDSYTLLGAHARLKSSGEDWSLTLFGTNLTNERYMTNGIQALGSLGTADAAYGRPREWGLTLSASF
tara:strand:+ start:16703 stop:19057 length:2355 start_codon:yes stop_codon:yes gene_type:complete